MPIHKTAPGDSGSVTRDDKAPGKPVVTVILDGTEVTDAGLKDLKKALPNCKIKK